MSDPYRSPAARPGATSRRRWPSLRRILIVRLAEIAARRGAGDTIAAMVWRAIALRAEAWMLADRARRETSELAGLIDDASRAIRLPPRGE